MVKLALALSLGSLIGWAVVPAQPAQCDPQAPRTKEQAARYATAVGLARRINTAEAALASRKQRYAPLEELQSISIPAGFEAHVSTDGASYTFSVKDKLDACGFALFSDQVGLIYNATPLQ